MTKRIQAEPELTPIARDIYRHLVRVLRRGGASITYGDLADAISGKLRVHRRSPRLYDALTRVTLACRARELPAVTAIVWKAGARRPSDGYYPIAHPRARSWNGQLAAWRLEHARVLRELDRLPGAL
jgi:hypothetical protein